MSIVEEVLRGLEHIEIWKRLKKVPDDVDELRTKVAALEEKLGGKWPPDVCKFCGERSARLAYSTPGDDGSVREEWKCNSCENVEIRSFKPK